VNKVVSIVDSQPARAFIYPCVLAIVAYLVGRGIIDSDTASWITGIVAAAVGAGAAETVHAKTNAAIAAARQEPAPRSAPRIDPGTTSSS
jgi:hypothetical protein